MNDSLWVWGKKENLVPYHKCARTAVPRMGVRNLRQRKTPFRVGSPGGSVFSPQGTVGRSTSQCPMAPHAYELQAGATSPAPVVIQHQNPSLDCCTNTKASILTHQLPHAWDKCWVPDGEPSTVR